jgi:hypothetical protein
VFICFGSNPLFTEGYLFFQMTQKRAFSFGFVGVMVAGENLPLFQTDSF